MGLDEAYMNTSRLRWSWAALAASLLALAAPAGAQDRPLDMTRIRALPGRELGRGVNREAATALRLHSYVVEELSLPRPVRVPIEGASAVVERAWRITITGEGFDVRAMPPVLLIDDEPAALGMESVDQKALEFIVFNPSRVRHGASLAITYEGDLRIEARDPSWITGDLALPAREGAQVHVLPETLSLDRK